MVVTAANPVLHVANAAPVFLKTGTGQQTAMNLQQTLHRHHAAGLNVVHPPDHRVFARHCRARSALQRRVDDVCRFFKGQKVRHLSVRVEVDHRTGLGGIHRIRAGKGFRQTRLRLRTHR